jgi:hypothetical protein
MGMFVAHMKESGETRGEEGGVAKMETGRATYQIADKDWAGPFEENVDFDKKMPK